ncbi:MAG TPA: 2-oxoacid:acceptor oxidoreductase subunit alpha, partial [Anaerolineales bacterium]
RPVLDVREGAEVGLIAFGSTDSAIHEARQRLAADGLPTDYLRLRAVPFTEEVEAFIREHERIYVVEMNTDGQMRQLLQLEAPDVAGRIRSIRRNNGLPLTARWIAETLQEAEGD